jgi:hypothetical protein
MAGDTRLVATSCAGAYFARTRALLEYLKELKIAHAVTPDWALYCGNFDDQLGWRHLHRQEYSRIKVDSLSKVFRRYDIFRGTECDDLPSI